MDLVGQPALVSFICHGGVFVVAGTNISLTLSSQHVINLRGPMTFKHSNHQRQDAEV